MSVPLATLNTLDRQAFIATLGHLFEQSPWIAADVWQARPFADRDALLRALLAVVQAASLEQQLALIKAHPDLAGKAAVAGTLTAASTHEQASAGLDRLTAEEFARFTALNSAYRERFGFPFIICVREHTRTSILQAFEERLTHERGQETRIALEEIARIARLRLDDTVT